MALPKAAMTPAEYLAFERASLEKHEYWAGEVFAMTGASKNHNLIVMNVGAGLHAQLRQRPCQVYASDMRVKTRAPVLYTYPDVSVVCGQPLFEDPSEDTLLNPTVIVEVLSPSTEHYDRGRKFQHYRTLDTLRDYILIAQDAVRVEHYTRQGDQWLLTDLTALDACIALTSIGCELALREVYEKVTFEAEKEADS